MYREYLGENYHWEVRKILGVKDNLCTDTIIDADLNVGAMKMIMKQQLTNPSRIKTEQQYQQVAKAAQYYLSGIICLALKSRTAVPPYNSSTYRKDWDTLRQKCMSKGASIIQKAMLMG